MLRAGLTILVCAFAAGCGGGTNAGSPPVVVVPAPSSPTPTPTPTPTPPPNPDAGGGIQALNCTVQDTVRQASSLSIRPVAGRVDIVAIGSSSTSGDGASSGATTYPAVLQQLLSAHPEIAAFAVYNKGLGGDTLAGTQTRLQREALDLRPQLVILQTGTNDAVNGQSAAALADYTSRLRTTVAMLRSQTAVLLMNGQHYPNEPLIYGGYLDAMSLVAREQNVAMFDRYALMKSWLVSGRYRYSDMLASDGLHPNDMTYRCMAQVVAELTLTSTVR